MRHRRFNSRISGDKPDATFQRASGAGRLAPQSKDGGAVKFQCTKAIIIANSGFTAPQALECAAFKSCAMVVYRLAGKHGSIAITERFIKSLKYECTRIISVPMNLDEMRHELALYLSWYNRYRPHEYLGARTPLEVYANSPPVKHWNPERAPIFQR